MDGPQGQGLIGMLSACRKSQLTLQTLLNWNDTISHSLRSKSTQRKKAEIDLKTLAEVLSRFQPLFDYPAFNSE